MPTLDVVKDICSGFGSRPVLTTIHALTFEHAKEALGGGVVRTTAHRTHTTDYVVCLQEPLVLFGGKLAASIRVQNDRGASGPLPHCHQHRLDDEVAILPGTHRPAHHQPGIQIQHHTQIQPMFGCPNIRDIGDPFSVGGGRTEVPVQMIPGPSWDGLRRASSATAAAAALRAVRLGASGAPPGDDHTAPRHNTGLPRSADSPRRRHGQHAVDESVGVIGHSPGSAYSGAGSPSHSTRWARPANIGTSSGWETRCGTVGSSDTSSRRSREERCRFSQKIPLLRDPG